MTRTKAGYCQHFAGAMALMLRRLGVPSRVAVGFTSGRDRADWVVTDHDAHAWVEVWFPGAGLDPVRPDPGTRDPRRRLLVRVGIGGGGRRTPARRPERARAAPCPRHERHPHYVDEPEREACTGARGRRVPPRRRLGPPRRGREGGLPPVELRDPRSAPDRERESPRARRFPERSGRGHCAERDARRPATRRAGGAGTRLQAFYARGRPRAVRQAESAQKGATAARSELRGLLRAARRELSLWARVRGFVSLRSLRSTGAR